MKTQSKRTMNPRTTSKISMKMKKPPLPPVVSHMRCAEHTLQLGVRDALKKASTFVTKIRGIATYLRNPHTDSIHKRKAKKGMIVDMPTRWGVTFLMFKRFMDLKMWIKDIGVR